MMTLSTVTSKKLMPLFMRSDSFDISLCSGIDAIVRDMFSNITNNLKFWDRFDFMTERQLDEAAEELCVHWYRYDVDVSIKRSILKESAEIKRKLGTVWATEQILYVYFGEATVVESWEYGGEKRHFKITTFNSDTVDKDAEMFMSILDKIKRKSAVLDYVEVLDYSTNDILYIIVPGDAEYENEHARGGNL